jgi:hypothetical protein
VACLWTPSYAQTKAGGKQKGEASARPQAYDLIDGVDCDIRVKTLTQDAYGNISADGVELVCDGQLIKLVDGKITNNWQLLKSAVPAGKK